MASVSQSSSTKTSVTLYVSALNTASNYDTITITCNGVTSGNLAKGGTGQSTSNSVTFGSLTCGQVYSASAYLHTTAGSTGSASGNGTTQACAPTPGTIASVSLSATGQTTMSGSWGTSTNASTYSYELWRSGGSVVASNYSYGSTSQTFSGLLAGTAYYLKVWGRNVDGISGSPTNSATVSTQSPPPSTPSLSLNSVNGKNISIQVSHSSDTTSIEFDYYWIAGYPDATKSVTGTSSTHTFTVPAYSTFYEVDCIAKNASGNSGWSTKLGFTSGEDPTPPASPTNLRKVSETNTTMLIAWDSVPRATGYAIEVYSAGTTTSPKFSQYGIAGTSVSATGLTVNTLYDIKVYASNSYGNSSPVWIYNQSTSAPPTPPTNFRNVTANTTSTSIFVAWDSVSTATSYSVEAYRVATGGLAFSSYGIGGTSVDVTGLLNYTDYDIKVWAVNAAGNSSASWLYSQSTLDGIAPVVTINTSSGLGTMNVTYSATDSGSGLRTPNRYAVHIGTQNGGAGTTVFKEYTDNAFHTFTTDADGLGFVHGASYWVKVYAYDNQTNSGGASVQITYTKARPTNWEWHMPKTIGQPVNATATEWNSFCTKINQFRVYKGYSEYAFTDVVQGTRMNATSINQAIAAINIMSPPTVPPTTKTSGTSVITATDFNKLRDSLNSIT